MIIKPNAEIDCYVLCMTIGITGATGKFPGGAVTTGIHVNDTQVISVTDVYGNVSNKSVLEGHYYPGNYTFVYGSGDIVAKDSLTLIF